MKNNNIYNLFKYILLAFIIYLIYINIYTGYFKYIPSIPIYPNNKTDLILLKKEMSTRTADDIEFFFKTNDSVAYAFLPYVSYQYSLQELNNISLSQNYIIRFFKYMINRRRPYQIDNKLSTLSTKTSNTPAYPAGHAYQALILANYLSKQFPDKKELFHDIALKCDECRVKAGIHYKSDGEFSRRLFKFFN